MTAVTRALACVILAADTEFYVRYVPRDQAERAVAGDPKNIAIAPGTASLVPERR